MTVRWPVVLILSPVVAALLSGCSQRPQFNRAGEIDEIRRLLAAPAGVAMRDGISAAVLIDTSGSMNESVGDPSGTPKPKIEIARQAVLNVLRQFAEYAGEHPELPVLVAVYEFSYRERQPSCRTVVPLGKPDVAPAEKLVQAMVPDGSTPVGDAMIAAKKDLDAGGLARRHILVVTDGESNRGFTPGDVTGVITGMPEERRASVYFIAFDVEAEVFDPVENAGGLVLAAAGEQDLRRTLDYILSGKILVEQPAVRQ